MRKYKKKKSREPRFNQEKQYDTPEFRNLKTRIGTVLRKNPGIAYREKDLYFELDLRPSQGMQLRTAMNVIIQEGTAIRCKGKRIRYSDHLERTIHGTIQISANGTGFIPSENRSTDVMVPNQHLLGARHGDLVEAAMLPQRGYSREKAKVIKILERNTAPVIGVYRSLPGRGGQVYPDNPAFPGPVFIGEAFRNNAEDGDRVAIDTGDYSRYGRNLRGKVVRVFGHQDDPEARFKSLTAEYKFRSAFSKTALQEADRFDETIPEEEINTLEDLRSTLTITIDPESAHDFDDAISLKKLRGNRYELGVHIADVSWYVLPGSALDTEARMRGTSVYTSHGTIPMLPDRLSSDLCSLRQGVDRRTVSVFMEMNHGGEILKSRISRSVICSRKRFTYRQVQDILDKNSDRYSDSLPDWRADRISVMLAHLDTLTESMRKLRFRNGGIDLDIPEYETVVNENNEVTGISKREHFRSNRIVEECMLAANRSVTDFALRETGSSPKSFIFRCHDKPNPEKLEDLYAFVQSLDVEWPFGSNFDTITSKRINSWLQSLSGHPLADVIRIHTLRALAKASYTIENIGHYGLGFPNYTHFTSPIRRLPDLIVHRLLLDSLSGKRKYGPDKVREIKRLTMISSERERAAQEMERSSFKIRQAEFLLNHIGEEFQGLIVSVIRKGAFVQLEDIGIQGLLSEHALGAVYYDANVSGFVQVDGNELYTPGLTVRVRVVDVDTASGQINLELV